MSLPLDLTGQRFGRLVAVQPVPTPSKQRMWEFICDCGNTVIRPGHRVRSHFLKGKMQSCGCHRSKSRGMYKHPVYQVYLNMLKRCYDPTHRQWENYGARGITVCDSWRRSFNNFWDDMKHTYQRGLSLDRLDNDGPYAPENCRWATWSTQANNKRNNVRIKTPTGDLSVKQAAELAGVKPATIYARVYRGWAPEYLLLPTDYRPRTERLPQE